MNDDDKEWSILWVFAVLWWFDGCKEVLGGVMG